MIIKEQLIREWDDLIVDCHQSERWEKQLANFILIPNLTISLVLLINSANIISLGHYLLAAYVTAAALFTAVWAWNSHRRQHRIATYNWQTRRDDCNTWKILINVAIPDRPSHYLVVNSPAEDIEG